jgi:hypothetical protein
MTGSLQLTSRVQPSLLNSAMLTVGDCGAEALPTIQMLSVPTGLPPIPSLHPTIVLLRFSVIEATVREELLLALPSV